MDEVRETSILVMQKLQAGGELVTCVACGFVSR